VAEHLKARESPIHRWYCIAEMLPIGIIRKFLKRADGEVLDPFVGVGTVLVEAQLINAQATGIDINPFMCFASAVKAKGYDTDLVQKEHCRLFDTKSERTTAAPNIPKIGQYYSDQVLQDLLALKSRIQKVRDGNVRNLFTLCFLDVAVRAANIKKTPAPEFKGVKLNYPVFESFKNKIETAIQDIVTTEETENTAFVCRGDSRDLGFLNEKYDLVLSSPPYCNNVDYVRHTQLELYWLGYAYDSRDLGRFREASLTSCEAMAHVGKEKGSIIEVEDISRALERSTKRAFPRVVNQYFAGMKKHLESLREVLKPHSKVFYVVGDSWIKGVYVPTHERLARIARGVGFSRVRTKFLRIRNAPRKHRFPLKEYLLEMNP